MKPRHIRYRELVSQHIANNAGNIGPEKDYTLSDIRDMARADIAVEYKDRDSEPLKVVLPDGAHKPSSIELATKREIARKQAIADAIANGPPGFSSIIV